MINAKAETIKYTAISSNTGKIIFRIDFQTDSFCTSDIPMTSMTNVQITMATSTKAVNAYTIMVNAPLLYISILLWNTSLPYRMIRKLKRRIITSEGIMAHDIILSNDFVFPTPFSHLPVQLSRAA